MGLLCSMHYNLMKTFQLLQMLDYRSLIRTCEHWSFQIAKLLKNFPIQLCTCHNSTHLICAGVPNWRICHWSLGNFKAWWNSTYLNVPSWGVYLIQLWTCHNSRHFDCGGAPNWRICHSTLGNFKAWWTSTYLNVPSWGVYLIQLWTCHNSRHFDCGGAPNSRISH